MALDGPHRRIPARAGKRDNARAVGRWERGPSHHKQLKGVKTALSVFTPWWRCTVLNIVSCGTDVINQQDKQITPNKPFISQLICK